MSARLDGTKDAIPIVVARKRSGSFSTHGRVFHKRAPRVLVAEDDTDLRAEVTEALILDGCVVTEARDGYELLERISCAITGERGQPPYDAIVTDIMMPGFSGLDVLTAIRRYIADTPVLVITGLGDLHTHQLAESLGSISVMKKPFNLDDLRTALALSLDISEKEAKAHALR